jgi:hypothetical protein
MVDHIMCGYVVCVPECRGSVCCGSQLSACDNTTYLIRISSNSGGPKKLPDDGKLLSKHVGASIYNKGGVQISA